MNWIKAAVGKQVKLIPVSDVVYFQSDAKYTRVVLASGEALIRTPLKDLLADLDPNKFWQVHRGTIVNLDAVAGVLREDAERQFVLLKQPARRSCRYRGSSRTCSSRCSGRSAQGSRASGRPGAPQRGARATSPLRVARKARRVLGRSVGRSRERRAACAMRSRVPARAVGARHAPGVARPSLRSAL